MGLHWSLEPARRILLAAWADLGIGAYEWAIYKAWRALASALAGAYGGLGPSGLASTAYMTAGLGESCGDLGGLWRCAARLDALALPLVHPEVEALLEVELGYTRAAALDSIECALKIAGRLAQCRGPRPAVPAGILAGALERLQSSYGEASLARLGWLYILAIGEARGKPYLARVEEVEPLLPPAALLVLAPEEAALLLGLKPWRDAEAEFIRDDYGLEAASSAGLLG